MELRLLFLLLFPLSVVAGNGLWKDVLEIGRKISDFLHQENSHPADLSKQGYSPLNAISSVNRRRRRTGPVTCNAYAGESAEDVVKAPNCLMLMSSTPQTLRVKTIDEAEWQNFASKLMMVNNVNIEIDASSIEKLDLPALTTASCKQITISNNDKLASVNIVVSTAIFIDDLIIAGNHQLKSVKIVSTNGFTGSIIIKDNKMLETLELEVPSITTKPQSGAAGLIIENNPKLGSLNMQNIAINLHGKMQIIGNENLASVDFSAASDFVIKQGVIISKNENLDSIKLPAAASTIVPQMEIKQNFKLKSIDSVEKFPSTALTIRGNPGLPQEVIDNVPSNGNNVIQEQGECIFDVEVSKLDTLTACRYIEGSLKFAKGATGSVPDGHQLSKINGDVFLADLPPNRLGFLKTIPQNGIKGKISTGVCGYVPNIGIHAIIQPTCSTTQSSTDSSDGPAGGGGVSSGPKAPSGNGTVSDGSSDTALDNTDAESGTSTKTIIIIVVAVIVGILLIVAVILGIVCVRLRYKKRKEEKKCAEEKRQLLEKEQRRAEGKKKADVQKKKELEMMKQEEEKKKEEEERNEFNKRIPEFNVQLDLTKQLKDEGVDYETRMAEKKLTKENAKKLKELDEKRDRQAKEEAARERANRTESQKKRDEEKDARKMKKWEEYKQQQDEQLAQIDKEEEEKNALIVALCEAGRFREADKVRATRRPERY